MHIKDTSRIDDEDEDGYGLVVMATIALHSGWGAISGCCKLQ